MSPAAAATGTSSRPFEIIRAQELRVASIAYRLSVSNRQLCRAGLAPQLGFVLHAPEQYGSRDRDAAARAFAFGSHIGVMAVVAGSPADQAGLASNDQLISVNGRRLRADAAPAVARPTRAFVERAQQVMLEEMRKGPIVIRVSSASQPDRDLRFAAEVGCRSNVELRLGDVVNAWADGENVVVSAGIVKHCSTDGDLALVIAHEMAHNLLRHGPGSASHNGSAGAGLAGSRKAEREADSLAVAIASAAAYDLRGSAAFLGRLMQVELTVGMAATHPTPDLRLAALRSDIAAAGTRPGSRP